MKILNKDKLNDACESRGLKIGWVLHQMDISNTKLLMWTYMKIKNNRLCPVSEMTKTDLKSLCSTIGCDETEIITEL